MISHQPKAVMSRTEHLEAYGLFFNGWSVKEIAIELKKTPNVIYGWRKRFGWDWKKSEDLRDIEQELLDKAQKARESIINIGSQTLDDVFIRDSEGNITGVTIAIENIKDLRSMVDVIMKSAGIAEKIENKTETVITGDVNVKTEVIDPEIAAMVGRALALKQSRGEDG